MHKVEYCRLNFPISKSIGDKFVNELFKTMQNNASFIVTSNLKIIINLMWNKYFIVARIYTFIYFLFAVSVFFEVIWCSDSDKCEQLVSEAPMVYVILGKVVMLTTFAMIVFFETIVAFRNGVVSHFCTLYNFMDLVIFVGFFPIIILSGTIDEIHTE